MDQMMEGQVQSFPLFQSPVLRFGCLRGGIPGMPGYDPGTMNIAATLRSRCYIDMLLPLFSCRCQCSQKKRHVEFFVLFRMPLIGRGTTPLRKKIHFASRRDKWNLRTLIQLLGQDFNHHVSAWSRNPMKPWGEVTDPLAEALRLIREGKATPQSGGCLTLEHCPDMGNAFNYIQS